MIVELEMEGASTMGFDVEANEFVMFTNEQFDRAFDTLEDAQDAIWLKSCAIPDFDW